MHRRDVDRNFFHPQSSSSNSANFRNQRQFPAGAQAEYNRNAQFFNNPSHYQNEYHAQSTREAYDPQHCSPSVAYGNAHPSLSYFPSPRELHQDPRGRDFAPANASYFNAGNLRGPPAAFSHNHHQSWRDTYGDGYQSNFYGTTQHSTNSSGHRMPNAPRTNVGKYGGGAKIHKKFTKNKKAKKNRPHNQRQLNSQFEENYGEVKPDFRNDEFHSGPSSSIFQQLEEVEGGVQDVKPDFQPGPTSSGHSSNFQEVEAEDEDYVQEVKPDFRGDFHAGPSSNEPMHNPSDEEEEDEEEEDVKPNAWVRQENPQNNLQSGSKAPSVDKKDFKTLPIRGLNRSMATLGKDIAEDQIIAAYKFYSSGQKNCKKMKNVRASFKWIQNKDDLRNLERYGKIFGTTPRGPGPKTEQETQKLSDIYAATMNIKAARVQTKNFRQQKDKIRMEVRKLHAIRQATADPQEAAAIVDQIWKLNEERIRANDERRTVHCQSLSMIGEDLKRHKGQF